jgi:hypothetical protein
MSTAFDLTCGRSQRIKAGCARHNPSSQDECVNVVSSRDQYICLSRLKHSHGFALLRILRHEIFVCRIDLGKGDCPLTVFWTNAVRVVLRAEFMTAYESR